MGVECEGESGLFLCRLCARRPHTLAAVPALTLGAVFHSVCLPQVARAGHSLPPSTRTGGRRCSPCACRSRTSACARQSRPARTTGRPPGPRPGAGRGWRGRVEGALCWRGRSVTRRKGAPTVRPPPPPHNEGESVLSGRAAPDLPPFQRWTWPHLGSGVVCSHIASAWRAPPPPALACGHVPCHAGATGVPACRAVGEDRRGSGACACEQWGTTRGMVDLVSGNETSGSHTRARTHGCAKSCSTWLGEGPENKDPQSSGLYISLTPE